MAKDTPEEQFHFYASSVYQWATTTPERDLRKLLALMDKDGHPYNLWRVPLHHKAAYKISYYAPVVDGLVYLGHYEVKRGR